MPDKIGNKKPKQGLGGLNPEAFMYEVADEIRAGLKSDRDKANALDKNAPKSPQKPV